MSNDSGIYVLYTDSDNGPEYRVTHCHSIDNIYGQWNEETHRWDGNIETIKNTFCEAPVFYTLSEAIDYAEQQEYDIGQTEDGICVINDFSAYGYIFA